VTIGASDPEHRRSSNLQLEEDPPDDLRFFAPARQRVACAHDRRHDGARLHRGDAQQLHSRGAGVRGLHPPPSRYGDGGGSAPLPAAPDAERHAAAEHQQFGLSAAFLFHRDTRPAGPCPAAHGRAPAAAATGRSERGGDYASAPGGARAQVQGGIRYRLRRRAARLRGGRAQGRRYRLRAHAVAG